MLKNMSRADLDCERNRVHTTLVEAFDADEIERLENELLEIDAEFERRRMMARDALELSRELAGWGKRIA